MNPYKVLEIPEGSDQKTIRQAFYKLSLIWHPDKNNNGAEKFKDIAQAYKMLTKTSGQQRFAAHSYRFNDIEEMLKEFDDIKNMDLTPCKYLDLPVTASEIYNGAIREDVDTVYRTCSMCRGRETLKNNCTPCAGNGTVMIEKRFVIEFKKGTLIGQTNTFIGDGDELPGKLPGNVVFKTILKPDYDNWTINDKNKLSKTLLTKTLDIELGNCFWEQNVYIQTLDNPPKLLRANVRKKGVFQVNVLNGEGFYIKDQGLPNYFNENKRDVLLVNFRVTFPKKIDQNAQEQLKPLFLRHQSKTVTHHYDFEEVYMGACGSQLYDEVDNYQFRDTEINGEKVTVIEREIGMTKNTFQNAGTTSSRNVLNDQDDQEIYSKRSKLEELPIFNEREKAIIDSESLNLKSEIDRINDEEDFEIQSLNERNQEERKKHENEQQEIKLKHKTELEDNENEYQTQRYEIDQKLFESSSETRVVFERFAASILEAFKSSTLRAHKAEMDALLKKQELETRDRESKYKIECDRITHYYEKQRLVKHMRYKMKIEEIQRNHEKPHEIKMNHNPTIKRRVTIVTAEPLEEEDSVINFDKQMRRNKLINEEFKGWFKRILKDEENDVPVRLSSGLDYPGLFCNPFY